MDVFVGFGASETFMTALESGLIDSCVINCDGVGTVITNNPTLVQADSYWIRSLQNWIPWLELKKQLNSVIKKLVYPCLL